MKSKEQIKKDIVDQLAWDSRVDANNVLVKVEDDAVRLQGDVPTYSAMVTAENIAHRVWGVSTVKNELNVTFPSLFTAPTDEEIKKSVEKNLRWNAEIDNENISVKISNGVVHLEGSVPTYWEKIIAKNEAQTVSGVLDVKNTLIVVPTETFNDEVVGTMVMNRVKQNSSIDAENIHIKVKNGTVTLSGKVPDWSQWKTIYDAAQYTAGVIDVKDNLRISYI